MRITYCGEVGYVETEIQLLAVLWFWRRDV